MSCLNRNSLVQMKATAGFSLMALLALAGCQYRVRVVKATKVLGGAVPAPATAEGPAALYLTIAEPGPTPDTLLSVSTDAARKSTLHSEVQEGGLMHMAPLSAIPIPARDTLRMRPGGYHVMLTGLTRPLAPGDSVSATLHFSTVGEVTVRVPVVSYEGLESALQGGP